MLVDFWNKLASADCSTLLLDYDGTLAPFRTERDQAVPYPGIRELLKSIQNNTTTRLVIISGRAIDDLLPLLDLDSAPEIWGCHGWEYLSADGRRPEAVLPVNAAEGLSAAHEWVHAHGLDARCEQKPVSVAIHWRGLFPEEQGRLRSRVDAGWQPIAVRYGLVIHPFDGGLELRCPGRDKGTAIREVLSRTGKDEPVAFLGDDLTDEDGFKEISGRGLGVLVRKETRLTRAEVQITPPEELLDFLKTWLESASPAAARDKGVQ